MFPLFLNTSEDVRDITFKLFMMEKIIKTIWGNPIILAVMAGIFFSLIKIPVPLVIDRSLDIRQRAGELAGFGDPLLQAGQPGFGRR